MSGVGVRSLERPDYEAWLPLWKGYLTFYEASFSEEIAKLTWSRFHDPVETTSALGAWDGDRLLGITHYHVQRSTWVPVGYVYLEDLFTVEAARGRGVGRALINAVEARARAMGASRLYWNTQTDNATARRLYDTMADLAGFVQYRKAL